MIPIRKAKRFVWLDRLNGSLHAADLVRKAITPISQFFLRTHAPTQQAEMGAFTITGLVDDPQSWTLSDLSLLPSFTIPAVLVCAGNRRQEMHAIRPIAPGELLWSSSAIGNAEWTGIPLRLLLEMARVQPQAAHIAFEGADGFGGSIPIAKAMMPEVIVAFGMNGQPLPDIHGGPARLLVPGYIGARSVKWLTAIRAQAEPSANPYQRQAYRLYPAAYENDADIEAHVEDGIMLGPLPVNAAISLPEANAHLTGPRVPIRGWAHGSAGHDVAGVTLIIDDQRRVEARLSPSQGPWSWRLWSARITLAPGQHTIRACARDTSGANQPEFTVDQWNYRGYLHQAQSSITITVEAAI